jgi:hypothetical protein
MTGSALLKSQLVSISYRISLSCNFIMSTFVNSSTLPDVPSLPPIQIPSSFRASIDHHLPPLDEDSHLSPHAITSFSPTHRQPMGSSNDAQTSPTNVSPVSANLRKSYSVDSFSRHPRPPPVSVVVRQQKASPVASPSDEQRRAVLPTRQPHAVDSPHVSFQARDPSFPLSGRSRGASISTSGDEASQPIPEESDGDPVRDAPQISVGARRAGSKFKGRLRPALPPGELPLPSRLHGVNAATSNSTTTADCTHWLPPIPPESVSLQNSKAGPSNRTSHEDMEDSGATTTDRKLGLDCGGSSLQSVSLVPWTQRTPSGSTI